MDTEKGNSHMHPFMCVKEVYNDSTWCKLWVCYFLGRLEDKFDGNPVDATMNFCGKCEEEMTQN